jgi:cell division protein FtsI (penicillin-binding protein 3)
VSWVRYAFYLLFLAIVLRSLFLQVIERQKLEKIAKRQYKQQETTKLQRGSILDHEGNYLAVSLPLQSITATPDEIENPELVATKLSSILKLRRDKILQKIKGSSFTYLQRTPKPQISDQVKALKLKGIHTEIEYQRFYPQQNHAAQLIGFSGLYPEAREGIEYHFNRYLMTKSRSKPHFMLFPENQITTLSNLNGSSVRLTIRYKLQYFTELELTKAVNMMDAKNGVAIIMESKTGGILAMAIQPDYDPNRFSQFGSSSFYNRAIGSTYEPGSTFKIITLAAALESKAVSKDNIFNCEEGSYRIHDRVIHDTRPNGWLSLDKIIQKSSNICAAKIGSLIDKATFYKMIKAFGFGSKTGIHLPGEATGTVHEYQRWTDIDVATISYGHGISSTPIQVITAANTIATGGMLIKPKVIEEIRTADNELIELKKTKPRRVISQEVANLIRDYMVTVTEKGGTGYSARLDGIKVAGKTGTSRKYDLATREYSDKNHISSFVGFFPADDPILTILVILDEPQRSYLGVRGVTPVFREISQHALRFYNEVKIDPKKIPATTSRVTKLFTPTTIGKDKRISGNNYFRQLKKRLMKRTLREVLTVADKENIRIKTQGSGVVYQVAKSGSRQNLYTVRLR